MYLDLAAVAAGAFLGSLVTGAAGFAFALVAGGVWVHFMSPSQFVFLASGCATLLHATNTLQFRKSIDYRRLSPFLLGAAFGVPAGVLLLQRIEIETFRHIVGAAILAYAILLAVRPDSIRVNLSPTTGRVADGVVGCFGGLMGGLANLHGILPTLWCTVRGWKKWESRLIYQPFILVTGVYVMLIVGANNQTEMSVVAVYFAASLPALALGMTVGARIFKSLSETLFRRLVVVLLIVSGLSMLI